MKIIKIKVFTESKKQKIVKLSDSKFEIYVKEPARNNLANQKIREIISQEFNVDITQVKIITGHKSPKKTIEINKN